MSQSFLTYLTFLTLNRRSLQIGKVFKVHGKKILVSSTNVVKIQ